MSTPQTDTETPEQAPVVDVPETPDEVAADTEQGPESADAAGVAAGSPDDAEPAAEEEPPPPPPPAPSLVEILRGKLQEKDDQLHSYIAAYKQAKEEMAKVQDRMRRDRDKEVARAKMNSARELLEVLDNLDRTVQGVPDDGPAASLAEGVRMVRNQFVSVLEGFGVERMQVLGATFDPKLHEAVGMVPAPPGAADQEVLFVQRAGYLFDGKLLRAPQVIVAAAS